MHTEAGVTLFSVFSKETSVAENNAQKTIWILLENRNNHINSKYFYSPKNINKIKTTQKVGGDMLKCTDSNRKEGFFCPILGYALYEWSLNSN